MTTSSSIGRATGLPPDADVGHAADVAPAHRAQPTRTADGAAASAHVVESHAGRPAERETPQEPAGPTVSPAELARQSALQAAMGRTLGRLDGALERLAAAPREEWPAASFAVASAASGAGFAEFASRIDREQVRQAVRGRLQDSNPGLSGKDLEALTTLAMERLDGVVNRSATEGLRKLAAAKLEQAASHFSNIAGNPGELTRLSERLAHLERPGASPSERAAAQAMRAGLGLDDARAATPEALRAALGERARLMRGEAEALRAAGDTTLFRRLLTHDVRGLFAQALGVRPGSWAEAGLAATHQRGLADEADLKSAKLVTSLAFAAVTAGTGAGVALGMAGAAAANAPSVAMAWRDVDAAAAGGSAGTAPADAEAVARHNAKVATGEAAAAVGLAGVVGGVVHAAELATLGAEIVAHVGGEYAAHELAGWVAHPFEAHRGEGDGEDAVSRLQKR